MLRHLSWVALAVALGWGSVASAAPRPEDKSVGPTVVGQAKSLNDLLKAAREMVKVIGGETLLNLFEKQAFPTIDPKQIPAIDAKRPFGMYGTLDADLAKCRAIFLVPVTSEKEFHEMLGGFGIKTEKVADAPGVFLLEMPDVPFPVVFKVHKEYAYIALGGADALEAKALYEPNEIIREQEKALIYFGVRLDRIPKETKKLVISNLQEQMEHIKEEIPGQELKEALVSIEKLYLRWLRMLFDEGKELAVRLETVPKTGEIALEFSVEGLPKSPLAVAFAQRPPTKNAFAGLAGEDCIQRLYLTAPLFADEIKDAFVKLLEYGQREALQDAQGEPAEVLQLIEAGFRSLKATVQSGDMDLAASFRGPNKEGHYNAVGAVHLKEAQNLEKALKAASKHIPEGKRNMFKFDTAKIGDWNVHEVDFTKEAEEIAKKLFGKGNTLYVVFGKDAVYAAYGPDGMKLLKEAIDAKPKLAASLDSWADGKKSAEVVRKMVPANKDEPGELKGMLEAMGKMENAAGFSIKIDGGEKLKIRITYGAIGLGWMFMGLGVSAGAEFQAVPGAVPPPKE